jgi:cyclic nucleotide-binding protein
MEYTALINKIQEYISLSSEDIAVIKDLYKPRTLHKGEVLLESGNICKYSYFVNKGLLRQFINRDGKELSVYFMQENTFACDFQSFISQKPADKTIVALEETFLWQISHTDQGRFYKEITQGERFGRLLLEEVFAKVIQFIISGLTDSPERRYLKFIKEYKEIQQRVPQYYIASFVGVTPESLSRIRNRLAKKAFLTQS